MITTEAYVIEQGSSGDSGPTRLVKKEYSFPEPNDEEVLAAPLYGCWETNMTHALRRTPVDICRLRREKQVVLGNSGVVQVLKVGSAVSNLREGDACVVIPIGVQDPYGYAVRVFGYDAPGTVGVLAKHTKLHGRQLLRIPSTTRYSLRQWAAFPVRYATAWDNWKVAFGCFRVQMSEQECPAPFVWGWGGGVAFAELSLARFYGCRTAMIASHDVRLRQIERAGITPIDRREFLDLAFDTERYRSDTKYKIKYLADERRFLAAVGEHTGGAGVSIFIDNVGTPVLRATLKALSRQGVITTAGWDQGQHLHVQRIQECIGRHIHVHTHAAQYSEGLNSVAFAEEKGWMPPEDALYSWEDIPALSEDFAAGQIPSYFPVYEVNGGGMSDVPVPPA